MTEKLIENKANIPRSVTYIIEELNKHGFEGYAVGGCVRDILLGRTPHDWDITTSAKPEEVKAIFKRTIDTGIQHGTVTVMENHEGYEVTTYRIDGEYADGRHPNEVIFTPELREDLRRRDFTINAMALHPKDGIVDMYEGQLDLERKLIRCVGNAEDRFGEDALRMMRAIRFAAQLGFEIEEETWKAIKKLAPNLKKISAERIREEMVKLLNSKNPGMFRLFYESGITAVVLPEFDQAMKCEQNNLFHYLNVGEHTLKVIESCPNDLNLRLAALLHDLGKPTVRTMDEKGIYHFRGHQREGRNLAEKIMRRLKMDNKTIDRVCALVLYHDTYPQVDKTAVRKMANMVGRDLMKDVLEIQRADTAGKREETRAESYLRIDRTEALFDEIIAAGECLDLKGMAVSGADLIAAGIAPGKQIGKTLAVLLEHVLNHPEDNRKEILLELALANK